MDKLITSDMLDPFGPTIKGIYKIMFPNGLTMQELADSNSNCLKTIYKHFKEETDGLDNH